MKPSDLKNLKKGTTVWLPCEVRSGPFPNERRVYLKVGDSEWFGFVDVSQLKDKVQQGKDCVKATVIGVEKDRVIFGIHGHAPASRSIEASPAVIGRLSPVPA